MAARYCSQRLGNWCVTERWFQEMMAGFVYLYLLRGRIKHDREAGCVYHELLDAALAKRINCVQVRSPVRWQTGHAVIRMDNLNYRICELVDGGWEALPEMDYHPDDWYYFTYGKISADSYLRFLEEFDAVVPEIMEAGSRLYMETMQDEKSDAILISLVENLMEEHLDKAGIAYEYQFTEDAVVVRMRLQGKICIRARIPAGDVSARIAELPSLLADPEEGMRKYGRNFRYEKYRIRY